MRNDSRVDGHGVWAAGNSTATALRFGSADEADGSVFDDAQQAAAHRFGALADAWPDGAVARPTGIPFALATPLPDSSACSLDYGFAAMERSGGCLAAVLAGGINSGALSFDRVTGQLAIRVDNRGHRVYEGLAANGFTEVTLDGNLHSSDPASASFDPALTGATSTTVAGIRYEGSGQDTLTLGPQNRAGGLAVQALGATLVTNAVSTSGRLAIQASTIQVNGPLQGGAISLAASDRITLDAAGSINAAQGSSGGAIAVTTGLFVNSGQLHADGTRAGQIVVQASKVLNAGPITADATSLGGGGGQVQIAFTDSYVATTAAMLSASGAAGAGGEVRIDGGSAGRLFSSGRHVVTGSVGGSVDLSGLDVVLDGATVDASGQLGGGSVRIGGSLPGPSTALANSQDITFTSATMIWADAKQSGNGGRVIVAADQATAFAGTVSARGGSAGGSGGTIKLSGKGNLSYGGSADAGASSGPSGTLLLDPKNITISAAPVGLFPQFDFIDPHPTVNGTFGIRTTGVLANGNVVVSNPVDDFGGLDAGAVYLFDGASGALLSTLIGGPGDQVGFGGVASLSNGNFVIVSRAWNGNRGAVTWANGKTGISGIVSDANSLVGSNSNDWVGSVDTSTSGIIPLSNGNYLVASPQWNEDRGAVTWGSGVTGVHGVVSAANSLVGSSPSGMNLGDYVGRSIITLDNSNYVVLTPNWNAGRGAVTWGDGNTGVSGPISQAVSLVGSDPGDHLGTHADGGDADPITVLSNGNYVVISPHWNQDRGAATWVNGNTGLSGTISDLNSLVGSSPGDLVGDVVLPLNNGNYVVDSATWGGYRGAVTWGDGRTGLRGIVSAANSLVGSLPGNRPTMLDVGDSVGINIRLLSNGNYVVGSPYWDLGRGAATWGNGSTGIAGPVSAANSLVGSNPKDRVGDDLVALSNGNYVVVSTSWNDLRGAVTWGNGTTGVSGTVSEANSLIGSKTGVGFGDEVGSGGITLLTNGNYVVSSPLWNGDHGSITWGDGNAGVSGIVSVANSLVDLGPDWKRTVVSPLSNGNYVVVNPDWNDARGAVTWGNGNTGVRGLISKANSLVGDNPGDYVGVFNPDAPFFFPWNGVFPLSNGNYVVCSSAWDGLRGAVTWGDGSKGIDGSISVANSLVGSQVGDRVGGEGITALLNGNYVVGSPGWNGGRGAATWSNGSTGRSGVVSESNSLVGSHPDDLVGEAGVFALSNGNYLVRCLSWNGNRGAASRGDGSTGSSGTISESNSLVGSNAGDLVGENITALANGDYVVQSPEWNGFRGAVTWGNGRNGVVGNISDANSLVGSYPWDSVGVSVQLLSNCNYVIVSPGFNGGRGAVTWVNGTSGQTLDGLGTITPQNSLLGSRVNWNDPVLNIKENPALHTFLTGFDSPDGGPVIAGYNEPSQLAYASAESQSLTITPDILTRTLETGTAVVLQASNDITVNSAITVSAGGHGGALTLQAGRSILLNASITTDNGGLTLIGNDQRVNGVIDAERDPGDAVIRMAAGTTLNTGSGPLTVELRDGAGLTHSESGAITLQGDITLKGGRLSGAGTVDTLTTAGGTIAPGGASPGVLSVANALMIGPKTTVSILLNGTAAGTGYAQLQAGGPIALGGCTLNLTFGFVPPLGNSFEILTNSGSSPITGTFDGLTEGAVFSQGGYQLEITYHGGTGGDSVVITRVA